jgi:hypothetical protein
MASLEDKAHDKLVSVLADSRCSPAVLALQMQRENTYVNESFIQYFTNYIIQMADSHTIPLHLAEVKRTCQALRFSLTELGLTGETRVPVNRAEYISS